MVQNRSSTSSEQLNQSQASQEVYRRFGLCIRSERSFGGRYVAELGIAKDGSIARVVVRTPSGVGDSTISECLAKRLSNLKYPPSSEPERTLRFDIKYY
ncbi:MAG TPA: hypothetical protein VGJ84_09980 [Polyangiaceae bacterium]|jgi:hypothetical protein